MEREIAIQKLKELQKSEETDQAHADADRILCDLLISLGYEDVIKEYKAIEKWYA